MQRLLFTLSVLVTLFFTPFSQNACVAGVIQLPVTGQTVSDAAHDDGDLEKGLPWPTPRFVDNGDGTVSDIMTSLVWLKNANCFGPHTWLEAIDLANGLASGACGLSDGSKAGNWWLPNRSQLESLMDRSQYTPALPSGHPFTAVQSTYYWSSSTRASTVDSNSAWYVGMDGSAYYWLKLHNDGSVWPVRSGQVGDFASLLISPLSNDYGKVMENATATQTFVLKNSGTTVLNVSAMGLGGSDAAMFTLTPGNGTGGSCGATPSLLRGKSCTVAISFTPIGGGVKSADFWISSNDKDVAEQHLALSGTGLLPSYTITSSVIGTGGGIACQSPVTKGESSVCSITPQNNYFLQAFTDDSVDKLAAIVNNSYTIANVQADHSIAGTFAPNGVCGTANGGWFTAAPTTGLCALGTPSAVSGTTHWSWSCSGSKGGTTAYCSADLQTYGVNFVSGGNGTVSGNLSQTINHGAMATAVTAVPAVGYHFDRWTGTNGFIPSSVNPLTVTNVKVARTITANFAIDTFKVNFFSGGNGTLSGNRSQTVDYGAAAFAVTAVPAPGYGFVNWTGTNGFVPSSANPLIVTNVKAHQIILANFAFTVTIDTRDIVKPYSYTGAKGVLNFTTLPNVPLAGILGTINATPWITIDLANVKFAKGKGSVPFTITPNAEPVLRKGQIIIGDDAYDISQAPHPCVIKSVVVSPAKAVSAAGGEQSITVNVEPSSCQWRVISTKIPLDSWFASSGSFPAVNETVSGDLTLTGALAVNATQKARSNTVVIVTADNLSKKSLTLQQEK